MLYRYSLASSRCLVGVHLLGRPILACPSPAELEVGVGDSVLHFADCVLDTGLLYDIVEEILQKAVTVGLASTGASEAALWISPCRSRD